MKNENFRNYYKIESNIYENEFISIFKSIKKKNKDIRAIKVIDKNKINSAFKKEFFKEPIDSQINDLINGFYNEIKNMEIIEGEKKENKNAVKLYECYNTKDELAIVMEYCDDNLFNYIFNEKNYLKKEEFYNIINQLNNSFKIIEKNKLVFGGLNPKNILMKYKNEENILYDIKLKISNRIYLNIESLKLYNLDNSNLNEYYDCCKAPEILKGNNLNQKSDLWSVGIIIYFLLFKEFPYQGKNKNEILNKIRFGEEILKEIEEEYLDDLVKKLLIEDPQKRLSWNEYFNHPFFKNNKKIDFWSKYEENKEKVGEAKYANIYRVKEKKSEEYRAIKVYNKKLIVDDFKKINIRPPTQKEMKPYIDGFMNEVSHMKMICEDGNINTVKILDYNETEEEFSIAMECCDDNFLELFVKKQDNFTAKEIYDLLTELNNSFIILNKRKLIHRALNLKNILIKYTNEDKSKYVIKLKLTDDCILLNELSENKAFKIKENINYYAPEILKKQNYTEKSDLWSLGVIIYNLLFREFPCIIQCRNGVVKQFKIKEFKEVGNANLDNLIKSLLVEDPSKRLSWDEYFHKYFRCQVNYNDYYFIGKEIGSAENAKVYLAKDKETKEDRAIKIYKKKTIRDDLKRKNFSDPTEKDMKPYIDGIFNEINYMKMISSYENKNTVKFYEYFHTNDEFAIVMELCDDNLFNYFNENKKEFDLKKITWVLNNLNNSFRIMSEMNLVHRALNMDNILIKYINKEKSDFIIKLKLTDDCILLNDLYHNQKHNIKKPLEFIAPEILKKEEYNQKCDLWSLGIIIYILVFKKYPYKNYKPNNKTSILQQINELQLEKTKIEDLDDLIEKLLTENQEDRLDWNDYFNHQFFEETQNYKNIYEIRKNIGNSKYAKIYSAIERKTKQKRAIKIYNKNSIRADFIRNSIKNPDRNTIKPYIKGFYNEINLMKMIEKDGNNEYSVKLYEYFNTKDEFIIVMELCDGNLLELFLERKNPFNFQEIKNILKQLNQSFYIMTENQVVHRALNMDNILIKYKDKNNYIIKLKLTDDCLINNENYDEYLMKDENKNFVAPEILKKNKYIEKSDLWSLGVIIYVLALKNYPYQGEKNNEILNAIKNMKLKKTKNKNLDDLIEKLLIEDPIKRISWNEYFNHPFLK